MSGLLVVLHVAAGFIVLSCHLHQEQRTLVIGEAGHTSRVAAVGVVFVCGVGGG